jgi:pimeloyl-ACP methyl ester carboxylesterase
VGGEVQGTIIVIADAHSPADRLPVAPRVRGSAQKTLLVDPDPFASAQELQRSISGSRPHPFHNSGHGVVIDEADAFNTALLGFLRSPA